MIKNGQQVEIICGKDKGKKGQIIEILRNKNSVKVKGINLIKKHEKTTKEKKGGIISKENFIDISNLKNLTKSTIFKLEISIKFSLVIIPPFFSFVVFSCFLIKFTPLTLALFLLFKISIIWPFFPLSLPQIISTSWPRFSITTAPPEQVILFLFVL